jgi:50S ribosomal protein L16 3-hydroxylase
LSPLYELLYQGDFFNTTFGKSHCLIKAGLPQVVGELEPEDVLDLCCADTVSSRLLIQDQQDNWQLHHSPLDPDLLDETLSDPELRCSVLVQNLENWSLPLARLWTHFCAPTWLQDDIMVSYAPPGGSVGPHFDAYDVFLVQLHGKRHWQLGGFTQPDTPLRSDQPINLVSDIGGVVFDQVLEPGDVLYVPPGQIHHGVAVDDCLTLSFGLRSPSAATLLDHALGELASSDSLSRPLMQNAEEFSNLLTSGSALTPDLVNQIKDSLIELLQRSDQADWSAALAKALSARRFSYEPEEELASAEEIEEALNSGYLLIKEPSTKLIITLSPDAVYCAEEEVVCASSQEFELLSQLAQSKSLGAECLVSTSALKLVEWMERGIVTLLEPE